MQLNTQQIVLLCLLVSFVTSIATGITTVSLLEQAPDPVTQTINRVVERTIERVIEPEQSEKKDDKNKVVVTPERIVETVVVNQEDLTVEAVSKNSNSLKQVYLKHRGAEAPTFATLGVVVSENTLVVDRQLINPINDYFIRTSDGDIDIALDTNIKSDVFAVFKLVGTDKTLSPANLGDSDSLQLAQTVISLGGTNIDTVSAGIIKRFTKSAEGTNSGIITGIDLNSVNVGTILLNLQGNIIGVKTLSSGVETNSFTPINVMKSLFSEQGN